MLTEGVASSAASRPRLKPVVLSLVTVAAVAVGGITHGVAASLFYGLLAALVAAALADYRIGLLITLSAAPFDTVIREQLYVGASWYPAALHVVDPLAAAVLVGWAYVFLVRRQRFELAWFDWAAVAFLIVLGLAALRGILAGYEEALRAARGIPVLALYLPARQALSDSRFRRVTESWIIGYSALFALVAPAVAFLFRDQYGRPSDVLLPRLCRVVDERVLFILLVISWVALWRRAEKGKNLAFPILAAFWVGGLLAINGTRTMLGGAFLALAFLALFLWRRASSRRLLTRVIALSLVAYIAGVTAVHSVNLQRERTREVLARRKSREVHSDPVSTAAASTTAPARSVKSTRAVSDRGAPPDATRKRSANAKSVAGDLAITMRLAEPSGEPRVRSAVNRVRELEEVREQLSGVAILFGHGVGLPVLYEHVEGAGKGGLVSRLLVHNAYAYFLHTTGLIGLIFCVSWLVGVIVAAWRAAIAKKDLQPRLLWLSSLVCASALLLMANAVGTAHTSPAASLLAFLLAASVIGPAAGVADSQLESPADSPKAR